MYFRLAILDLDINVLVSFLRQLGQEPPRRTVSTGGTNDVVRALQRCDHKQDKYPRGKTR